MRTIDALEPGQIQFFDDYQPSLEAGRYVVTATQAVDSTVVTDSYFVPLTQTFDVVAPQFALDATDIAEQFPPPNSSGIFGRFLPQIVLNRRVLPWARRLDENDPSIPWMALLTFDATELGAAVSSTPGILTKKVSEVLAPEGSILKPKIDASSLPQDVLDGSCTTIVIAPDLFRKVMPRTSEVKWLAHVRESDTRDQAAGGDDDVWYSVVVSNRFPNSSGVAGESAGTKNVACLVSLEGFLDVLGKDASVPAEYSAVEVVVLATWSFVSVGDGGQSLGKLFEGLASEKDFLPRIDTSMKRLAEGYVPLPYRTPAGEETFAWYRGPLSPVKPQPVPKAKSSFTSSSELTIYVEIDGVFDLSYAAAWEAGRAAALADRAFALAMLKARRGIALAQRRAHQRSAMGLAEGETAHQKLGKFFLRSAGFQPAVSPASSRRENEPPERPPNGRQDVGAPPFDEAAFDMPAGWLANLGLLENVPFNHLFPDARMLPVESIRFFHVDPSWIDALTDGALSLGVQSSRDVALNDALREPLMNAVAKKRATARARKRNRADLAGEAVPNETLTGIAIRSAAISGWPGLSVRGKNDDGSLVETRRLVRLSEDVLLCLFAGTPSIVEITEPLHGLRFGVDDHDDLELRNADGARTGNVFAIAGFIRGDRVLDVGALVPAVELQLFALTPALFAMQLVRVPERLTFSPAIAGGRDGR